MTDAPIVRRARSDGDRVRAQLIAEGLLVPDAPLRPIDLGPVCRLDDTGRAAARREIERHRNREAA